jgi:Flp pilus assembly protein TadG
MRNTKIGKVVWRAWRRFAAAKEGSVAFVMGLMLMPAMLLVGATIDYGRGAAMRTTLQGAVDGAAIAAAAAVMRGDEPAAIAEAFVKQRLAGTITTDQEIVTRSFPGSVIVSASMRIPTMFMRVADVNTMRVAADARAAVGAGGQPVELAIVLDTTESMAQQGRLDAAKAAAKDLIDTIMLQPDGSTNRNVRVGLVPFAKYVNIGTQYQNATWLNAPDWLRSSLTWQRCELTCKDYDEQPVHIPRTCYDNDATPRNCDVRVVTWTNCRRWGLPRQCFRNEWKGCVRSEFEPDDESDRPRDIRPLIIEDADSWFQYDDRCPRPLTRLSRDPTGLKDSVAALAPEGETYIAPGLLWGWRLLSPNPPFEDGSTNPVTKKFIVLMTDGANTHSPYTDHDYGVHEGTDVDFANEKLLKICGNVKNAGIKLYTIAFKVTDQVTKDILSRCATSELHHYNAQTNSELREAFGSIGSQLTTLRLLR